MSKTIRKTGIPFIPALPWGSHTCAYYSSTQDLIDLLVPYFKAGLLQNEFCLWIVWDDLTVSKARKAMRNPLSKIDKVRINHQMEIIPQNDWYFKHRSMDAVSVRKAWMKKLSSALEQGYEGLRTCGIAPWLTGKGWKDGAQYEKKVDGLISGKKVLLICAYSIRRYSINELIEALNYHGSVLIKLKNKWEYIKLAKQETITPSAEEYGKLTARERQVMRLVSEGLTSGEIASMLSISRRTVEAHRANLMGKLRLQNQADLVRFALTGNIPVISDHKP